MTNYIETNIRYIFNDRGTQKYLKRFFTKKVRKNGGNFFARGTKQRMRFSIQYPIGSIGYNELQAK